MHLTGGARRAYRAALGTTWAGSRNFGYGDTRGAKIVNAACARRGTVAAAIPCCRAQKRGHDCWT